MIWLLIGIIFISIIVILLVRASKGPAHTLETLEEPIRALLNRGYDGGFLVISIEHSKYFLQFKKYIKAPGDFGIKLCFPKAKWSNQLFDKLISFCRKNSIEFKIEEAKAIKPLDFLYIDFFKDTLKAHEYTKRIFLEVFELEKDNRFFVKLENAAIEDIVIDK